MRLTVEGGLNIFYI